MEFVSASGGSGGGSSAPPLGVINKRIGARGLTASMAAINPNALPLVTGNVDASATGVTFQSRVALNCESFDRVRILIPNCHSADVEGVKVGVRPARAGGAFVSSLPTSTSGQQVTQARGPSDAWDNNPQMMIGGNRKSASNWILGAVPSFPNDFTFTLPAVRDTEDGSGWRYPTWTATDWIPCMSVARDDGGTLPLVDVRIQYPIGEWPTIGGVHANWGIDGELEATRPFNGGRLWRTWAHPGLLIDAHEATAFNETNTPFTQRFTVPFIIQYHSSSDVVTFLYVEDSMGEQGFTEHANNWAFRGILEAEAETGIRTEYVGMTRGSSPYKQHGYLIEELMPLLRPTVLWAKPFGPNDITSTNGTQGRYGESSLGHMITMAEWYRAVLIAAPMLAVEYAGAYQFGANDSYRRDLNAKIAARAAAEGFIFADLDTPWTAGMTPGTGGQHQPGPGMSGDGVHPTEASGVALTPNAKDAAVAAIQRAQLM